MNYHLFLKLIKRIVEALELNYSIRSIDEPINDEGRELTLKDVISNEQRYDINDLIWLREELSKFSPKEKGLIQRRYYRRKNMTRTTSDLGITQVEVSRMEKS